MCSHIYKKIIVACIIVFLFGSCSSEKDNTWDAFLLGIPSKITPNIAKLNMGYYILKQTHEPLLRNDRDYNYFSNIFSQWERSIDNKYYKLCLDTNNYREFNDESQFTIKMLKDHLISIIEKKNKVANL